MSFSKLFKKAKPPLAVEPPEVVKPLLAVVHLKALPGSPRYGGTVGMRVDEVYRLALEEAVVYQGCGADGLIVENFGDAPFYPGRVPAETVAAMSAITRDIVQTVDIPVGVNVLRNDAESALAIAAATGAHFIRVNMLMGAHVADQGLIQGVAHRALRLRRALQSEVLIMADIQVKHATSLGGWSLEQEVQDAAERGLADALIISGTRTGAAAQESDIAAAKSCTDLPVLVGSGVTEANLETYHRSTDGFIVGSCFKIDGHADNPVEEKRVWRFVETLNALRKQ